MMRLLIIFLLTFVTKISHAQDDDFFDDEFEEPYEDPLEPRRGEPVPPPRGGGVQPRNAPTFNPPTPAAVPQSNQNRSSFGGGGANKDEIVFQLVDPPKYWKPKKRRFSPPVKKQ